VKLHSTDRVVCGSGKYFHSSVKNHSSVNTAFLSCRLSTAIVQRFDLRAFTSIFRNQEIRLVIYICWTEPRGKDVSYEFSLALSLLINVILEACCITLANFRQYIELHRFIDCRAFNFI
jgi:hypothetical protein